LNRLSPVLSYLSLFPWQREIRYKPPALAMGYGDRKPRRITDMSIIENAFNFIAYPWWHTMVFIGAVSSALLIACLICMYLEKKEII
jgi:hypothetical protein